MSDETANNDQTLKTYNAKVGAYISNTAQNIKPGGDYAAWLEEILKHVTAKAKILEIGSGFGRDAKYMIDRGYNVTLSDAATGFVNLLKKAGYQAKTLNVLSDPINNGY